MANFLRHTNCDKCGSKDNLAIYDDGSYHCFGGCGNTKRSQDYESQEDSTFKVKGARKLKETSVDESKLKPKITKEQNDEIKAKTEVDGGGYRGIKNEVLAYFGVRTRYVDDEIDAVYYPVTYKGQLSGYKIRQHPKDFSSVGRTGKECDLFGQFRFANGGRTCLIVGGEHDQLAAYQILREYQLSKGNSHYDPPCVVSPTIGETSCAQQLAGHYKWFDSFEKIIVAFDNDEAGQTATEKAVEVLPKGKVYVMKMRHKDPNKYLDEGDSDKFLRDYYEAKKYVPAGIVGSDTLMSEVLEYAAMPKIPLPPFMKKLQEMTAGGFPLGFIINIGAGSGIGKTSVVNELIYYWLFNSPYKIGVVTMELSVGQYGEVMLSRHIQKKIALIPTVEEKLEFLNRPDVQQKADELFKLENGDARWMLIDDRDGSLEALQDVVEELVISCGCKVIVLDPLQDLLDGLSNEEQAVFMKWQKSMLKSHGITFININHTRKANDTKNSASTGAFITEEDFAGSSTIFKSAGLNLLLMRDKYHEDPIIRNTTKSVLSKNRTCGLTGSSGDYYYDNETHTLYDYDYYFSEICPGGNAEF